MLWNCPIQFYNRLSQLPGNAEPTVGEIEFLLDPGDPDVHSIGVFLYLR